MAQVRDAGCAGSTGGPAGGKTAESRAGESETSSEKEAVMIKVGQKAPDFEAPGYQQGKLINVKLSDYLGKWVVLCFYPGDFTFV